MNSETKFIQDDPPVIAGKITSLKRSKPQRARADWLTFRGYAGIALGTLIAFSLTAGAAGAAQLVFIVIWIVAGAAIVSFTKYDRHRRITGKEK